MSSIGANEINTVTSGFPRWAESNPAQGLALLPDGAEVVANVWLFCQARVIYAVGVKPYVMTGGDDHKFALLQALAPYDHRLAPAFRLPERYCFQLGERKFERASFACGSGPIYESLDVCEEIFVDLASGIKPVAFGAGPEHLVRVILNWDNLLHIRTFVEAEDGRLAAKIPNWSPPREPEATIANWWEINGDGAATRCVRTYRVSAPLPKVEELLEGLRYDVCLGCPVTGPPERGAHFEELMAAETSPALPLDVRWDSYTTPLAVRSDAPHKLHQVAVSDGRLALDSGPVARCRKPWWRFW